MDGLRAIAITGPMCLSERVAVTNLKMRESLKTCYTLYAKSFELAPNVQYVRSITIHV